MTNVTKTYNILLRALIVSAAYGFIIYEVFKQQSVLAPLLHFENHFIIFDFWLEAIFVFVLMLLNWGLEALKWRYLVSKIENISFLLAFKAVLSGLTVSIFTPNRVGEYFGRVFLLKQSNPLKGILITILGSMAQLVVYVVIGSFCFVYYLSHYQGFDSFFGGYFQSIGFTALVGLGVVMLAMFLNVNLFIRIGNRLMPRKWHKVKYYLRTFGLFSKRELIIVLAISFLRYCVFTFQYFFLLRLFGLALPTSQVFLGIAVIFFIMTAIPTFALAELGIRSTVALWVLGGILSSSGYDASAASLSIVSAASALWVINLGLPALIGGVFVRRLRFFKKKDG
jgi:hypothetical protein